MTCSIIWRLRFVILMTNTWRVKRCIIIIKWYQIVVAVTQLSKIKLLCRAKVTLQFSTLKTWFFFEVSNGALNPRLNPLSVRPCLWLGLYATGSAFIAGFFVADIKLISGRVSGKTGWSCVDFDERHLLASCIYRAADRAEKFLNPSCYFVEYSNRQAVGVIVWHKAATFNRIRQMASVWPPPNTWFRGCTKVCPTNGISIGSSVFAGLTSVNYTGIAVRNVTLPHHYATGIRMSN